MSCNVEGCNSTKRGARGMCAKHYTRFKRHGDVDTVLPGRATPRAGLCDVDGCGRRGGYRGMCRTHRYRLVEFGDPMPWVPIGDRAALVRESEPEPEACIDCGGVPMPGGLLRCESCLRADLKRRTARKPVGGGSPDPARTAVRQVRRVA